jgi:hypothetical protein
MELTARPFGGFEDTRHARPAETVVNEPQTDASLWMYPDEHVKPLLAMEGRRLRLSLQRWMRHQQLRCRAVDPRGATREPSPFVMLSRTLLRREGSMHSGPLDLRAHIASELARRNRSGSRFVADPALRCSPGM